MKTVNLIAAILFLTIPVIVQGASIEVFPADLRNDKTIYAIGNELNSVHFIIYSDRACGGKSGRYKLKEFEKDIADAKLSFAVDLPKNLKYLGLVNMSEHSFAKETDVKQITIEGKNYIRHTISLNHKLIMARIVKGKYRYDINLWIETPAKYSGEIYWRLLKNGQALVKASNKFSTVGLLPQKINRPDDFIFFLTYADRGLPTVLQERRIELYKKMGVTHIAFNYSGGGFSPRTAKFIQKIRRAGIKTVLQRSGSFSPETRTLRLANSGKGALYPAALECYNALTSKDNQTLLRRVKKYMDGFLLDYEQSGAAAHPSYNDKVTVAAFCQSAGIKRRLTAKRVKKSYRNQYLHFRDKLLIKPITGVAALIKSVKPGTPFFVEQGTGMPIGLKLDYKLYNKAATYNLPMIYTSPLDFYQRVGLTAQYVGRDKLIPTTCAGYTDSSNKILSRKQRGGLLLDVIGAASQGIAGIKHWPGPLYLDGGQIYEFCQAATLLGKVNGFYKQGRKNSQIQVSAMPYLVKKFKLPGKTLVMPQPQWKNYLMTSVFSKGDATLITLLNYHPHEKAFVKISIRDGSKALYLKNINTGKYLTVAGKTLIPAARLAKGVVVKVPAFSPGLWLLTTKQPTVQSLTLAEANILREFAAQKVVYGKKVPQIQLGKKGKISISYAKVKSDLGSDICLEISSPEQSIYIKSGGGIIWQWLVHGKDLIIRKDVNDGAAMDLLWLPETARWSGDERNEMRLVKCINSGKEVTVIYEQKLQNALPNVVLRKTFRIPADRPVVQISIALINHTEQPQQMAYWSHNLFGNFAPESRIFMVLKDQKITMLDYKSSKKGIYSNRLNGGKFRKLLLKKARNNYASNCFGEYFKDAQIGVVISIPKDFLQIYRWAGKGKGSIEWMGAPQTIATGDSYRVTFTMSAITAKDPAVFMKKMLEIAHQQGKL